MPEPTAGGTPAQGTQGSETPTQGSQPNQAQTPANFDEWLKGQDETVKGLYDTHTKGLRSALDSERTQRGELAKQIKDLAGKAEKGSVAEQALTQATAQLEAAERRADFMADAGKPEIGCTNARAAFALAQAENLFDRKGQPDWPAIKAAAPELFGRRTPAGNAGTGTGTPATPAKSMNDFIRRAAGRES